MEIKKLLKPLLLIIIFSAALATYGSFEISYTPQNQVVASYGFPLTSYTTCRPVLGCPVGLNYGINYPGLVVDFIFWFIVFAILMFIVNLFRKKSHKNVQ